MNPTALSLSPASAATLADAILILHVGIVAFVVLGTALILIGGWRRWRWVRGFIWRLAHLLLIAFVVLQTWLGALCPLTVWSKPCAVVPGRSSTANPSSNTGCRD